jgi:hypothetical protein
MAQKSQKRLTGKQQNKSGRQLNHGGETLQILGSNLSREESKSYQHTT